MSIDEALQALEGSQANIKFSRLVKICTSFFGRPRTKGGHHIFKMPWPGDPRINLQKVGSDAKPYQVRDVIRALRQLREQGE